MQKFFALLSAALFLALTVTSAKSAALTGQSDSRTVSAERPHHKTTKHKARKKHKKPKTAKPKASVANQNIQSRYEFPRPQQAE